MDLFNEEKISKIWQPYQKLSALKWNFHTFFKLGVEYHYENGFGNHRVAPRYKGIDQTYLMSYKYRQSGNPIRSYTFLKPGVEIHYENCFGNHQIVPRYKGIDHTYLMSY